MFNHLDILSCVEVLELKSSCGDHVAVAHIFGTVDIYQDAGAAIERFLLRILKELLQNYDGLLTGLRSYLTKLQVVFGSHFGS